MGPIREFLNRTVVPNTLYARSLIIVITPIVLLQIVVVVIFYNRHLDTMTRWLSTNLAASLSYVADNLDADLSEQERRLIVQNAESALDLRLELFTISSFEPGRFGLTPSRMPNRHIDDKIIGGFEEFLRRPFSIDLRPNDDELIEVVIQIDGYALRALVPKERVTSTSTMLLLGWMVVTAIVLVVIAVYYLQLQVSPIRRLANAVTDFGKGRDDGDFVHEGPSEIRHAATAFNRMRHRILRHIGQRTELLASVSHDLRTPLTRMRLELEMLDQLEPEIKKGLENDVEEMRELVDLYLSFARGEGSEKVEMTSLAPFLRAMAERARRSGAEVRVQLDQKISLPVRPLAFKRCLSNIVDNACTFGKRVDLGVRRNGDQVDISIEDDGPGVPEDSYGAILKPFVSLESSRRVKSGGLGLGLAIAYDIILGHGGELQLDRSKLGGLKVTVSLPY